MIKNGFLILFLCVYSLTSFAKTLVFSDIDDTVKKAYTLGGMEGYKVFLKKEPFIHTRDLFLDIYHLHEADKNQVEFFYVSAAPRIAFDGKEWIKKHNFPSGPVILKTPENSGETFQYKYLNIKNIILDRMKRDKDLSFIFFGDNSQHDPKVYLALVKDLNLQNAQIYIRDVSTKAQDVETDFGAMPVERLEGINYYFSEMDLIQYPYFSFVTYTTLKGIQNAYNRKALHPYYVTKYMNALLFSTCQKRTELDEGVCQLSAKDAKDNFLSEYYSRY